MQPHDELSRKFVFDVLGAAVKDGATFAELMTVLESALVATMLLNVMHYGMKPAVASGLVEAAVQRAIERFSEQMK